MRFYLSSVAAAMAVAIVKWLESNSGLEFMRAEWYEEYVQGSLHFPAMVLAFGAAYLACSRKPVADHLAAITIGVVLIGMGTALLVTEGDARLVVGVIGSVALLPPLVLAWAFDMDDSDQTDTSWF